jgi:AraC-like DNA-binding protein
MKNNIKTRTNILLEMARGYCSREGNYPTPIPTLRVVRRDKVTEPVPGRYASLVCIVLQGEKRVWSGKKIYRYNPENYLVSCVDVPAIFQVTEAAPERPYIGLTMELQPSIIYEILHEAALRDLPKEPADGGFLVERMTEELTDAFIRLLGSLPNDTDRKILAPSIIREIHYRLLTSNYSGKIRQLGMVGSKTQKISKVVEHLQKDYALPLRINDLAEMANMSPSAFHLHFREVTNMSPLQYQKQIRLQEARRMLSVETVDAASVAFKVGYESPSQFSREYRRLFGQPPMRDLEIFRMSESVRE